MQQEGLEEVVVVRYGELFLKSEPVKRRFIGVLLANIEKALKQKGCEFRLEHPRGRIIVHGRDPPTIARVIAHIFGVVDTRICLFTGSNPEDLARACIALMKTQMHSAMTFAIRVKRELKRGIPSPELAAFLGSEILREIPDLQVDLDHPQLELQVEVREIGGFVCGQRIPAPGGLPFGTQGTFLSLLSSGIDSPVAAWMMMKRGCVPVLLFFDAETWSGPDVRRGAIENLRRLSLWCPGYSLEMNIAPNGELFQRMEAKKIPPRFRCVICKRFMYRVASTLAKEYSAWALVTGENLGQVASQTLVNLATISEATSIPVLRPLITYDKKEIIDRAREIGTFPGLGGDLSCRAVPHKPSTGAELGEIKALEDGLDIPSLIQVCTNGIQKIIGRDGQITEEATAGWRVD